MKRKQEMGRVFDPNAKIKIGNATVLIKTVVKSPERLAAYNVLTGFLMAVDEVQAFSSLWPDAIMRRLERVRERLEGDVTCLVKKSGSPKNSRARGRGRVV